MIVCPIGGRYHYYRPVMGFFAACVNCGREISLAGLTDNWKKYDDE